MTAKRICRECSKWLKNYNKSFVHPGLCVSCSIKLSDEGVTGAEAARAEELRRSPWRKKRA